MSPAVLFFAMLLDHHLAGLPTDRYWKNSRGGIVTSFKVVVAVDMIHSLKTFVGDVLFRKYISLCHFKVGQQFFHTSLF